MRICVRLLSSLVRVLALVFWHSDVARHLVGSGWRLGGGGGSGTVERLSCGLLDALSAHGSKSSGAHCMSALSGSRWLQHLGGAATASGGAGAQRRHDATLHER
jgi:hypothetical protein